MRQVLTGILETDEVCTYDYRFFPDEGEVRWLRSRAVVSRDEAGSPVRVTGTSQEITESKENEDALSFLSAMGAAANNADTLQDVLLSAEEIIKPHVQWPVVLISVPKYRGSTELIHLDIDWAPTSDDLRAAAQGLATRVAAEGRIIEEVGPSGTVLIGGAVQAGGRLGCVLVSDTRRTSFGRPSDLAIFSQMIAMLTSVAQREWAAEELAAARDQALEASKAKSVFLTTMSHEIRTPLNGVIGLSELLASTDLTPHQRKLSAGVDQAGRTLLALINDILDLSKIEAGHLELELVDFDPRAVLEQSAALVADQARTKELELIVSSANDVPEQVRGDPVRFGQVITNLAANAVKFTSTGEVSIRATGGHEPGGMGVRVEVSDTGVGISTRVQDRLFQPFTQADTSTTRQYGGTGLGLAISKRIVSAMDGQIGVHSEAGVGSTFWFTVTLAPPLHGRRAKGADPEDAVAGLRVLIVDDNETNRFILTEKLTAWTVENNAVASTYEALVELDAAIQRRSRYDIVLLDYMMPGADGEQLARIIRSETRHDRTRLALLSSAMEPSEAFLSDAGIDTFLSKPVLATQLLETLTLLGGRLHPEPDSPPRADALRRSGLGRILVVEDNPVNQLVAEGILHQIGYEVLVAENGAAGVAVYTADPMTFDAILMDSQMPVMNGYDATRAIRATESAGRRIPIIAMTAAAVAEERQRCLHAGMDDFLTKPVDRSLLTRTLKNWTNDRSEPTGVTDEDGLLRSNPSPAGAGQELTLEVLDRGRLTDLIEGDAADLALVLRILERFADGAEAGIEQLAEAMDKEAPAEVAALAHALRGSASNIGLVRLARRYEEVESSADTGHVPSFSDLDEIRSELSAGLAQLKHIVGALTPNPSGIKPSIDC